MSGPGGEPERDVRLSHSVRSAVGEPVASWLANLPALERAVRLADAFAVSDIEDFAACETRGGQRWYDTRPMLDPREHAPEFIDLAEATIGHVLDRELAVRHPYEPHLVRLTLKALGTW